MKKFWLVLLSVLTVLTMLPMSGFSHLVAAGEVDIIVNVKDFGAVGDGVTDDRTAIMNAFNHAVTNYAAESIPVTVYFPEGEYGLLNGGMYIKMPYGSGNLTVKGDGAEKSTLVYLDEWNSSGGWVALRFLPKITPTSVDEYLHDITIQDLGVYDTDPEKHAIHVDKGDPSSEETHGFNIQHCVRATIKDCKVVDVGDECFDLSHCIDSSMTNNLAIKNRITGNGGGCFSVGDGSRNVTITNNRVVFDTGSDNVSHYGVTLEAFAERVEDIYITHNTVEGVNGWGVCIGPSDGKAVNVLVQNNTLTDCRGGGVLLAGTGYVEGAQILDNYIANVRIGIYLNGTNNIDTLIDRCIIENILNCAVNIHAPSSRNTVVQNVIIRNAEWRAVYNGGTNTVIDRVLIDGSGTAGDVTDSAIIQYSAGGDCTIANLVMLNCQNKKGIQGISKVTNTYIQQPESVGYTAMAGCGWIENCRVNRVVTLRSGGIVDGLVLYTEANPGAHAVTLSNLTGCTVTNCVFTMPSRNAVCEMGTADSNTITNNVTVGGNGIKVIGAHTMVSGNITGTAGTTETYRYRVADGKATITEWLDTTATKAVIPSTIGEYPVVSVEAWAFALCDKLTGVVIPDSITAIGANAFFWCDGLIEVHYLGSVAQWDAIDIGVNNNALLDAPWYSPSDRYADEVAHSVMDTDHGNGLAFRFTLCAEGVAVDGKRQVDLTGATVNYLGEDCKLVGFGAVVTNKAAVGTGEFTLSAVNGSTVIDIPAKYLLSCDDESTDFAVRIINISDENLGVNLYARPYYIIEVDGEQVTVYGDVDVASCVEYM